MLQTIGCNKDTVLTLQSVSFVDTEADVNALLMCSPGGKCRTHLAGIATVQSKRSASHKKHAPIVLRLIILLAVDATSRSLSGLLLLKIWPLLLFMTFCVPFCTTHANIHVPLVVFTAASGTPVCDTTSCCNTPYKCPLATYISRRICLAR